jgi:NitT/TauT family transport system substrate-binding protein
MENGSAAVPSVRGRHRGRRLLAPAVALVALLVAACGGGGGGGGGGSSNGPTTLKVGVIPIADVAPL